MDTHTELCVNRLCEMDEVIQAYYLGFPVHMYIPNSDVIADARTRLSTLGITDYCNHIYNKTLIWIHEQRKYYHPYLDEDMPLENYNNTFGEKVHHYNLFDTLIYFTDDKCYVFNRSEYDMIIKDHRNPWTDKKVPDGIYRTAFLRNHISQRLNLPESDTIHDLLMSLIQCASPVLTPRRLMSDLTQLSGLNLVTPDNNSLVVTVSPSDKTTLQKLMITINDMCKEQDEIFNLDES